jgi:hypothetical protein
MRRGRAGKRPFRYEMAWESKAGFSDRLKEVWVEGGPGATLEDLQHKISNLSSELVRWGRNSVGSVQAEIRSLQHELDQLWCTPDRLEPGQREQEVVSKLRLLLEQEEVMWRQRSRVQWLAAGDKNTHFFHLRASQRRKMNRISELIRSDGSVANDEEELGDMASDFYRSLYTSEGTQGVEEVLGAVPVKVTAEMNDMLNAPFDAKEVKSALFEMYPTKAPGQDGFPAHFFQRNWDICGEEVTRVVLRILAGEESPEKINKTFIVMIPKIASSKEMGQFRPISLCNVIYKIASKVAANRLKKVLPEVISAEQSAFVPGRLITDNIITAYECLHFMKRSRAKKHQSVALKLDMRKAYDRVEWNYLREIMLKLGFSASWVGLVMRLVTTVSFSVLFNGSPKEEFRPSRGI